MKIDCLHGFFKFQERYAGDLSRFISIYGLPLARRGDYFTFENLVDAPDYSIEGGLFLDAPTPATFEGEPWEVMRENSLVYNFNTGLVSPINTINQSIKIFRAGDYYLSNGMILPGSVTEDGLRVRDYSAFVQSGHQFFYSEIGYD